VEDTPGPITRPAPDRRSPRWLSTIHPRVAKDVGVPTFELLDIVDAAPGVRSDRSDALSHELQPRRRNEAPVDEALGLPRAPASIVFIGKATVPLQEAVEGLSGARQDLPEVARRGLQHLRSDIVGDAQYLSDQKRDPLAWFQTQQHAGRAGDLRLFYQQWLLNAGGIRVRHLRVRYLHQRAGHIVERPGGAAAVEQVIAGNAVEPRPEFTAPLEAVEPRHGLDEDLLGGIFGIGAVPQHPVRDMKHPHLVTLHQRVEGGEIALLRLRSQATVFCRVVGERVHGTSTVFDEAAGHL
jgi:hypothetical protein